MVAIAMGHAGTQLAYITTRSYAAVATQHLPTSFDSAVPCGQLWSIYSTGDAICHTPSSCRFGSLLHGELHRKIVAAISH